MSIPALRPPQVYEISRLWCTGSWGRSVFKSAVILSTSNGTRSTECIWAAVLIKATAIVWLNSDDAERLLHREVRVEGFGRVLRHEKGPTGAVVIRITADDLVKIRQHLD